MNRKLLTTGHELTRVNDLYLRWERRSAVDPNLAAGREKIRKKRGAEKRKQNKYWRKESRVGLKKRMDGVVTSADEK